MSPALGTRSCYPLWGVRFALRCAVFAPVFKGTDAAIKESQLLLRIGFAQLSAPEVRVVKWWPQGSPDGVPFPVVLPVAGRLELKAA